MTLQPEPLLIRTYAFGELIRCCFVVHQLVPSGNTATGKRAEVDAGFFAMSGGRDARWQRRNGSMLMISERPAASGAQAFTVVFIV
jgi:hypothetical protein